MGDERILQDNAAGTVFIRVAVPDLKVQKCLQFRLEHTVWQAKQRVLSAFAKELRDALNYGLYLPPANGRAGKFMEEERTLSEYPIQGPIGFLEFKYKRRIYKVMQVSDRKLKQLHAKSKLKVFMDLVRAGSSDKLSKLTTKGLDPNFHDQDNGETPLTTAMTLGKSKCREIIITLVSGGAHLDFRNKQGLTALHRAAIVGNSEAIRTMLDLGASPDCKDIRDLTPLYYSVSNDDSLQECTLMLLHERARTGVCDEQGWYEIHQACKHGRVQHLEHLVFYGADMDVRNSCGNTPLHICALNNQEACARLLLFRGADPTLCNYNNQTAGQAAAMAGNNVIAKLINSHNPDDVVPYREIPQYSNRRKGASLTPSLRALMKSRSDPRINIAGLDSRSASSSPYGGLIRRQIGGIDSDSACSISVTSTSSVTGVTDQGMYEGRTMTGREGYFPGGHLSEVNIRRAESLGDVNKIPTAANHRNTLATLTQVDRQQLPRVVLLHRSADGYGFVLRGAKSKLPMGGGFNDFSPTPEYPALQYLDSVDPGSQADRAGLKGGDFILEINGENVVRASHEHVVHLIRSSSDVLSMRVLTVTPSDHMPADWQTYQDSGAMTLPSRKKTAAPLPPQRDPRTSLSYSKGSSKSMTEGLAEIEKLDAAIAEFETLDDMQGNYYNSDDHKMAMMRANAMVVTDEGYDGAYREEGKAVSKAHMSPAEARIQKYHKTATSQALERSKSTPDIAGAIGDQYADRHHAGGHIGGSWTKKQAPAPPRQEVHIGISLAESGPYPPRNDASRTPNLPHRAPGVPENSASAPHTPEFSRILASRTENEKHRRTESQGTNAASTYKNNQNGDKSISFADEKVMENANKFIQKYPNATLLVTADIHSNKLNGSKDRVLYEPDPDYDSDDERSTSTKTSDTIHSYSGGRLNTNAATDSNSPVRQNKSSVTVISINNDANRDRSKQTVSSHSSSYLINGSKSSPKPVHVHDNVALTSPVQSLSSSRRSSGVVMATPSQPSSAESSRRSSIQSNYSGDAGDKSNKTHMISSASATAISSSGRSLHEAEIPPPPPPPPPVLAGGKSTPPGGSANSTLRHRPNEMGAAGPLQSRVSTDDILAAVAERRNRLETEGPRFSEVRTLSASKSTQEMNHEALVAAVAKRKTLLEQGEDNTVVNDIESRLNRNKKLQAAKYFNSNINRGSQDAGKDGQSGANSLPPSASSGLKLEEQAGKNVTTAAKEIAGFDKPEPQAKLPTPVPLKSNKSEVIPSKTVEADNVGSIDFRARLKPVDVKGAVSNIAVHSKTSLSSSAASAPGTNVTTIVMSKAGSNKVGAPPTPPAPTTTLTGQFPPPPPATSAAPPPPPPPSSSAPIITSKSKADLQATSNKTGQSSTETIKSPISPTSPNNNTSDYIALAEKARQEYLKKKASGSLQANIERKGPVEITPNRKNFPRGKTTSPASPTSPSDSNSLAQTKPAQETKRDTTQVSVQDRIKTLQPNNKTVVAGVTEDHSHTELSLSNGTTRKPKSSISITPHQNVAPPSSKVAPPTLVHSNKSGNPSTGRGVALNIIPPPTSFGGTTGSPDSAFSQDDAASFVSSASSLSTASSEHGGRQTKDFKDLLAHSPPPPPDFNDFSLGDQDAFIPPPPEFLEIDSNANESKRMDENSKPFANKAASSWSCVDVLDWLDSLGLPQYRIGFAKAGVDGPKLVNMGRNEFIDLGVSQVGHRMSLERSVKKLNMGPSTNL